MQRRKAQIGLHCRMPVATPTEPSCVLPNVTNVQVLNLAPEHTPSSHLAILGVALHVITSENSNLASIPQSSTHQTNLLGALEGISGSRCTDGFPSTSSMMQYRRHETTIARRTCTLAHKDSNRCPARHEHGWELHRTCNGGQLTTCTH